MGSQVLNDRDAPEGELRGNPVHAVGLYCKNCGEWLKWVGNGEKLKAVIKVERSRQTS
jgi:hypothetical protein